MTAKTPTTPATTQRRRKWSSLWGVIAVCAAMTFSVAVDPSPIRELAKWLVMIVVIGVGFIVLKRRTNSCWLRKVSDGDSGETYDEYVCRFIEVKTNVIKKSSARITSTSRADSTYGVMIGLVTGDFYEGCKTHSQSSWKCSYEATKHWYQKTTKATFQNYYLPALLAIDIPGKIKCMISIFEFVLGVPIGSVDPSSVIDDCKATVT